MEGTAAFILSVTLSSVLLTSRSNFGFLKVYNLFTVDQIVYLTAKQIMLCSILSGLLEAFWYVIEYP
jgi:hypothetical protein